MSRNSASTASLARMLVITSRFSLDLLAQDRQRFQVGHVAHDDHVGIGANQLRQHGGGRLAGGAANTS